MKPLEILVQLKDLSNPKDRIKLIKNEETNFKYLNNYLSDVNEQINLYEEIYIDDKNAFRNEFKFIYKLTLDSLNQKISIQEFIDTIYQNRIIEFKKILFAENNESIKSYGNKLLSKLSSTKETILSDTEQMMIELEIGKIYMNSHLQKSNLDVYNFN